MRKLVSIWLFVGWMQPLVYSQAYEPSLIWRISGNGLSKSSYLFGTIHAICNNDFFLPPAAEKALAESEQLALELKMDDPLLLLELQKGMMMPQGNHLKNLLSASDYERLNRFLLEAVHMDLSFLGFMKPIALASLLYPQLMNCNTTASYELKLMEIAKKQNKQIIGIETVADQLKVFDAVPLEQQTQMLMEMLNKQEEQTKEMQALVQDYKQQNINALYERFKKSSFATQQFEDELLTNRNRSWVDKIVSWSSQKAIFYAVGAGHLGGPNGLIALLRSKGFVVEPVQ
ncbi:MAG: TraB/GumN family protein [Cytophagales bacterium]|nr:TraB/GumN family protein [Bernardetiaceae bacterium]MDW8203499.1 TraB/GumN family protein [Cytophagales bacterium]